MKYIFSKPVFADGGNGGEGGEGGGNTPTLEQLQAQLTAANDSVSKLTAKNNEILEKNRQYGESLKQWEGLDPTQIRGLLDKISGDDELKLIAEGKYEDVIKKRTEKIEVGYKTKLTAAEQQVADLSGKLSASNERIRDLLIDSKVVSSFFAESGLESASPDVVARARSVFKVEDGEVVARNSDGEIITGKDGAMTIKEWIGKLKQDAPHLFPGSVGSGASGGKGNNRSVTGLEAKIAAAAASGDNAEYRRLRKIQQEQKNKKE